MPDILIRGLEMPCNCFQCPLFSNCDACEGHECGCGLLGGIGYEEDISEDRRRDDCPLHELPPHGDLIDKDAFIQWLESQDALWERSYTVPQLKKMLRKGLPVVAPAERSDTDA